MTTPPLPTFLALDVSKSRVGYAVNHGALVQDITAGSPADLAGCQDLE